MTITIDTAAADALSPLSELPIQELADHRAEHCISLYLPVKRAGREVRENPIRLKNMIKEAEEQLLRQGASSKEVCNLLEPVARIVNMSPERWGQAGDTVAFFLDGEMTRAYGLPVEMPELTMVARRFHVAPLLRLEAQVFYILALSQHEVRLFEATPYTVRERDLPENVPYRLEDALGWELTEQTRKGYPGERGGAMIYHGHGGGKESENEELWKFLSFVDKGLRHALQPNARIVLAGTPNITGMYKRLTRFQNVLDDVIEGNHDKADERDLLEPARQCIHRDQEKRFAELRDRFNTLKAQGFASADLKDVLAASQDGRIEVLLASDETHCFGQLDEGERTINRESDEPTSDGDLVDLCTTRAWHRGARVYLLPKDELPDSDSPVAAIFYH